jgi:hypothetical protein
MTDTMTREAMALLRRVDERERRAGCLMNDERDLRDHLRASLAREAAARDAALEEAAAAVDAYAWHRWDSAGQPRRGDERSRGAQIAAQRIRALKTKEPAR